jgi:cell division FtsZ-interacting protein ZapD
MPLSIDELQEIRIVFQGLQTLYETYLPKADPLLINDLLVREQKNYRSNVPLSTSYYVVEISTNDGKEFERMREVIHQKTGLFPSIYDNGTRYVVKMELNLEILRGICNSDESIIMVNGRYTEVNQK